MTPPRHKSRCAHAVQALRQGRQPDTRMIREVGYLMRTTAVYGNGKFGIADRHLIDTRPGLEGPFAAEMLAVWLIRHFTHDLVEHVGGAPLDRAIKRHLGIGNATGLGMAPFLLNHPILLNNWIKARETALARVRSLPVISTTETEAFLTMLRRGRRNVDDWHSEHPLQCDKIDGLKADLDRLDAHLALSLIHI